MKSNNVPSAYETKNKLEATSTSPPSKPVFSIYFHIPYCHQLCHYCDFAKTANFTSEQQQAFFSMLLQHTRNWLEWLSASQGAFSIKSIYFGGGTPSIETSAYQPLIAELTPFCHQSTEVTLEANPNDLDLHRLNLWKQAGINRLSLGIQSFSDRGLQVLTRQHDHQQALTSVELSRRLFENLNIDLIYGWHGQTEKEWQADLDHIVRLRPAHVSLYNLTYAEGTPLGRAKQRGKVQALDDDLLAMMYERACEQLDICGYHHEEISNWHQPGFPGIHNQHYWNMGHYIGIGPGAHGFLPNETSCGVRYLYDRNDRRFLKDKALPLLPHEATSSWLLRQSLQIEQRTESDWLTEVVANGLRTAVGINLRQIENAVQKTFQPNAQVLKALHLKLVTIDSQKQLQLHPHEWFRENAWAAIVIDCFQ